MTSGAGSLVVLKLNRLKKIQAHGSEEIGETKAIGRPKPRSIVSEVLLYVPQFRVTAINRLKSLYAYVNFDFVIKNLDGNLIY